MNSHCETAIGKSEKIYQAQFTNTSCFPRDGYSDSFNLQYFFTKMQMNSHCGLAISISEKIYQFLFINTSCAPYENSDS